MAVSSRYALQRRARKRRKTPHQPAASPEEGISVEERQYHQGFRVEIMSLADAASQTKIALGLGKITFIKAKCR
jgi:hypothetical protein